MRFTSYILVAAAFGYTATGYAHRQHNQTRVVSTERLVKVGPASANDCGVYSIAFGKKARKGKHTASLIFDPSDCKETAKRGKNQRRKWKFKKRQRFAADQCGVVHYRYLSRSHRSQSSFTLLVADHSNNICQEANTSQPRFSVQMFGQYRSLSFVSETKVENADPEAVEVLEFPDGVSRHLLVTKDQYLASDGQLDGCRLVRVMDEWSENGQWRAKLWNRYHAFTRGARCRRDIPDPDLVEVVFDSRASTQCFAGVSGVDSSRATTVTRQVFAEGCAPAKVKLGISQVTDGVVTEYFKVPTRERRRDRSQEPGNTRIESQN